MATPGRSRRYEIAHAATRGAVALEPATTILAIGGVPGRAYSVSAWEYAFRGLATGGQEGAAIFAEGVACHPDKASLPYNLACMHALDADADAALDAPERAIELEPKARDWACGDDDLKSLRGNERFGSLLRDG